MSPIILILFFNISIFSLIYLIVSFLYILFYFFGSNKINKNPYFDYFNIGLLIMTPVCKFIIFDLYVFLYNKKENVKIDYFKSFGIFLESEDKSLNISKTYLWDLVGLSIYLLFFTLKRCIDFEKKISISFRKIKKIFLIFILQNIALLILLILDNFHIYQILFVILILLNLYSLDLQLNNLKNLKKLIKYRIKFLFLIIFSMSLLNVQYIKNELWNEDFIKKNDYFYFLMSENIDKKKIIFLIIIIVFFIEIFNCKIIEYCENCEETEVFNHNYNFKDDEIDKITQNKNFLSQINVTENENAEENYMTSKNQDSSKNQDENSFKSSFDIIHINYKRKNSEIINSRKFQENLRDSDQIMNTSNSKFDNIPIRAISMNYNNRKLKLRESDNNLNQKSISRRKKIKNKEKNENNRDVYLHYILLFRNDILRISIFYLLCIFHNIFSLFYLIIFFYSFFKIFEKKISILFIIVLMIDFLGFSFINSESIYQKDIKDSKAFTKIRKYFFNIKDNIILYKLAFIFIFFITVTLINIPVKKDQNLEKLKKENSIYRRICIQIEQYICLLILPFFSKNDIFHTCKIFLFKISNLNFCFLFLYDENSKTRNQLPLPKNHLFIYHCLFLFDLYSI